MGDTERTGQAELRALFEGGAGDRPGAEATIRHRDGRTFLILSNEFATVHVSIDRRANGVRLVVSDPEGATSIGLDPLELEAIARMRHDDFDERILERAPAPDGAPGVTGTPE
jgi:hypothetical protein